MRKLYLINEKPHEQENIWTASEALMQEHYIS